MRKQITRRRVYHHLHCKCISSVARLHITNMSTLYIINRKVVYNAPKVQFMRFIAIHEGIAFNSYRPKFAIHYVNQRLAVALKNPLRHTQARATPLARRAPFVCKQTFPPFSGESTPKGRGFFNFALAKYHCNYLHSIMRGIPTLARGEFHCDSNFTRALHEYHCFSNFTAKPRFA